VTKVTQRRGPVLSGDPIDTRRPSVDATGGISARIALCVRKNRLTAGLSLEGLAERSGVSRSMLSLIERGEASPTAVLLERIASALGVSLATLFEDPAASADPVSRGAERNAWRDPETGYVRCNISPSNTPSPIQIVDVVLPAGAAVAYETAAQDPGIPHQIWVRQGRIEVSVGGATHQLEQDDCLAIQLSSPITYRNRTRQDARYIVVLLKSRPMV